MSVDSSVGVAVSVNEEAGMTARPVARIYVDIPRTPDVPFDEVVCDVYVNGVTAVVSTVN